jgi:hypothetical protein
LHELGHFLAGSNNAKLPSILKDLDDSILFSESFADLLALTIHGNVISPSEQNPTCLDRLRYISSFQSYNYPQEYFQSFSEARIRKCCESLVRNSQEDQIINFCKAASEFFDAEITFSTTFDPNVTQDIDDHQIGIPVLSFLTSFAQKTNQPLKNIFEKMFFPESGFSSEKYVCNSEIISIHTGRTLLKDFRQTLNQTDSAIFDKLFEKHAIEKGLVFAQKDVMNNVMDKAKLDIQLCSGCILSCKEMPTF